MFLPIAAVAPWLTTWLSSLWLICLGVLLGTAALLLIWGILFLVRPKAARQVPLAIGEGVLLPITFIVGLAALFGLAGAFVSYDPQGFLDSLTRLHQTGESTIEATFAASDDPQPEAIAVSFRADELRFLKMEADQYVLVMDGPTIEESSAEPVEIGPMDSYEWSKGREGGTPFGGVFVPAFYVTNPSGEKATVTVTVVTAPVFPEVAVVPFAALSVVGLYLLYFVQAWCVPRVSAIALATTKSEIAQPMFMIILVLGIFLILLFEYLPYNTFGEDIKMLKDSGLTLIMVLAIIQGVWAASNSVSDEIEGRTALTVLSKPIGRRQFILGKFFGILWTVALLFIILGTVFLVVVAYKPIYDAREMGAETPPWNYVHVEVIRTIPGLVLAFFETTVLVSLSVAISTRLPMLANFVICFSIYVLGHLTPLLVQAPIDFPPVVFIGRLIATILPVLDHFNIQAAVAAGKQVPLEYLAMAFVYCVLYSLIALLLALALFEDRDLA